MFRPLAIYIGLRYTRAKRRQHFISFISLASMIGIALGVTVLITVLSVMNGFDYEIRERLFNLANQVTISHFDGVMRDWKIIAQQVDAQPNVVASAPFVRAQGMFTHSGNSSPILAVGILPDQEGRVSNMASYLTDGSFDTLTAGHFNAVIGKGTADALHLHIGDKVNMFTTQANMTPLGIFPRFKAFKVTGIFHVEDNPQLDTGLAFINMHDAQVLYQVGNNISGLRLKVSDLYAAPLVSAKLETILPADYAISNWTQEFGTFFKAVRMEKTMIFLLLVLIIAVAAFNLVSTLVMVVNDKQADIAILRTLGATPKTIMATFMVQGFTIGILGTFLGLIGGILLALNTTEVVHFIQEIFHMELMPSSVYFVDHLPSRLLWSDVWQICAIALILSLLATIYPAWQASRTQPAEALRYE